MRTSRVLLAASCLLSAAIAVQPAFDDGEFLIDTAGVHVEWDPAVAFDGTDFLVVWTDYRNDPDMPHIYGARVSQAGTVLDPSGFPISTAAGYQDVPAVTFDRTNFLVVWQHRRIDDTSDIYGARVSPAGTVLDPSGIAISTAADNQLNPSVAFDGANFLVVWQDRRSGPSRDIDIYCARVSPVGTVLDPSGIAISTALNDQHQPAVTFDGTDYLLVWADGRGGVDDIYGARVSPAGVVLDSSGFAISTGASSQWHPSVASDGMNSLAVWEDYRSGGTSDIYGARVTPQGTVLDPSGIVISQVAHYQEFPALASDGTGILAVWQDYRSGLTYDIYGARVSPDGTVSGEGPIVTQEGDQDRVALCRGQGSQMFLVCEGWAGAVGGKTYNTDRTWGKMNPGPGIEESPKPQAASSKLTATVVRGVLDMASSERRVASSELLDISGRRVMELQPGANDVSRLPPGVYFIRAVSRATSDVGVKPLSAVSCQKVVIQK